MQEGCHFLHFFSDPDTLKENVSSCHPPQQNEGEHSLQNEVNLK